MKKTSDFQKGYDDGLKKALGLISEALGNKASALADKNLTDGQKKRADRKQFLEGRKKFVADNYDKLIDALFKNEIFKKELGEKLVYVFSRPTDYVVEVEFENSWGWVALNHNVSAQLMKGNKNYTIKANIMSYAGEEFPDRAEDEGGEPVNEATIQYVSHSVLGLFSQNQLSQYLSEQQVDSTDCYYLILKSLEDDECSDRANIQYKMNPDEVDAYFSLLENKNVLDVF